MRTAGTRYGRRSPSGATRALALPLAGAAVALAGGALAAGVTPMSEAIVDGIPGLDVLRVVVPNGELAGRTLQVSEVGSRLEPAELLGHVERAWRGQDGASVLRADGGAWSMLSRQTGDGFETLQLRVSSIGGSEGWLTQWSGARARPRALAPLAHLLPSDARVARQLSSHDGGDVDARTADTLLGQMPHSIDEAERRIDRHLRRAGFAERRRPEPPRGGLASRDDRARFYRAPGAEVLITLHAQPQGTGFVLYHVRRSP